MATMSGLVPCARHLFRYVTNQPPKANSAFHPAGVSKWVPASAGKAKAGMVHSVSWWTRGVQAKLWNPLRTRAIPERLRGVFTTRRYTNPRLPYLSGWILMKLHTHIHHVSGFQGHGMIGQGHAVTTMNILWQLEGFWPKHKYLLHSRDELIRLSSSRVQRSRSCNDDCGNLMSSLDPKLRIDLNLNLLQSGDELIRHSRSRYTCTGT